jgi:hypothetical protein
MSERGAGSGQGGLSHHLQLRSQNSYFSLDSELELEAVTEDSLCLLPVILVLALASFILLSKSGAYSQLFVVLEVLGTEFRVSLIFSC